MDPLRPRVRLNFAASLDGKIAPLAARRPERFTMSRGREDFRRMKEIRAASDAILIGAGNLRADDPPLALAAEERERRRAAGIAEPYRIVVTSRGDGLRPASPFFDPARGGPSVVVHAATMPGEKRRELAACARLVELGAGQVDVGALLAFAARDLGVGTLLCEGGGVLAAELFAARAVDELFLTLVPRILGGGGATSMVEGPGFPVDAIPDAKLVSCEPVGDELYLRYAIAW